VTVGRIRRSAAAFSAIVLLLVATTSSGAGAVSSSPGNEVASGAVSNTAADARPRCSTDVFDRRWRARTVRLAAGRAFTAAVIDTETGCVSRLRPRVRLTTASAIKSTVLAVTLARAQPRPLTRTQQRDIESMIGRSHNPPTTRLLAAAGVDAMAAYTDAVGVDMDHSWQFGSTITDAAGLAAVTESILRTDSRIGPLSDRSRRTAWRFMSQVHPAQRWGVTAAVPAGYETAFKNGFYPCQGCPGWNGDELRWRVSSAGYIRRVGEAHGYVVAVLTDGNKTQREGIELVEHIAGHINRRILDGPSRSRVYDRMRCITVAASDRPEEIAARLDARWAGIRSVSGGEGPLHGQMMCAPRPEPFPG
jgi:hypothetical protein